MLDLHTHLFNARYVPLASVIANAMGKDEGHLANPVAEPNTLGSSQRTVRSQFSIRALKNESPNKPLDAYGQRQRWAPA